LAIESDKLTAARYVVHKLVVHKYAQAVVEGRMAPDTARVCYGEAMRNFDMIVSQAGGPSRAENEKELARGPGAIGAMIEELKRRNG
jgi:hypothetical protein